MTETRILRLADVVSRVGLRKSAIYDRIRHGDFPPPIQLSPRAVGWRAEEVDAWIASRPVAGGRQAA